MPRNAEKKNAENTTAKQNTTGEKHSRFSFALLVEGLLGFLPVADDRVLLGVASVAVASVAVVSVAIVRTAFDLVVGTAFIRSLLALCGFLGPLDLSGPLAQRLLRIDVEEGVQALLGGFLVPSGLENE